MCKIKEFYLLEMTFLNDKCDDSNLRYRLIKIVGNLEQIDDTFNVNAKYYNIKNVKLDEIKCERNTISGYGYMARRLFLNEPKDKEIKDSINLMKKSIIEFIEKEIEAKIKELKQETKEVQNLVVNGYDKFDFQIDYSCPKLIGKYKF